MKTRIRAKPSLRMLPLCLLYRWQPAIREAMTEINTIVLCIQVRIVAVGGICPSCIIVTKLNLKHWPRMNEST